LTALLASGDNRKVEATKMAIQWIQSHPWEMFCTIFLLKYATPDISQALRLVEIQVTEGSDFVHLILHETYSGSVTSYEIPEKFCDNVRAGGDTWECGNWGDVVGDLKTGATLRVSLSECMPDWGPHCPQV
jgi:hypothetical protein